MFAKMFGVYVHEYSIGMGKKVYSKKPKNSETEYNIRLFPIGGFVRLAGEEGEDGDNTVPEDRKLYKKGFVERFLIFFMGPGFNFILCLFLGYLGAHKFYEGKAGMGILYVLTVGLFGIGWFIDCIVLLCKPNPYYVR